MSKEFQQRNWDKTIELELQRLLEIAVSEDVENIGDLTSRALVPESAHASASVHVRENGVVAGVQTVKSILWAVDPNLHWKAKIKDGTVVSKGDQVGVIEGPARSLLTAERLVLNFMGRLSGIASLTKRYVDMIIGTSAKIYDTRKTTPGWRLLEKYAVRCGGGQNHRSGLYDAVLIKDNHLAFGLESGERFSPAEAVLKAREYLQRLAETGSLPSARGAEHLIDGVTEENILPIIEIEVDTLEQLKDVLPSKPDIVLLDNMNPETLRQAVEIRNRLNPDAELEASGGINLQTLRSVAETGVERISSGALTHSAIGLDIGLDWGK